MKNQNLTNKEEKEVLLKDILNICHDAQLFIIYDLPTPDIILSEKSHIIKSGEDMAIFRDAPIVEMRASDNTFEVVLRIDRHTQESIDFGFYRIDKKRKRLIRVRDNMDISYMVKDFSVINWIFDYGMIDVSIIDGHIYVTAHGNSDVYTPIEDFIKEEYIERY